MIVETEHPHFGVVRQVAGAVRVGHERPAHRRAPRRNEHGDDILAALLGYGPEERARLTRAGAFGRPGTTPIAASAPPEIAT